MKHWKHPIEKQGSSKQIMNAIEHWTKFNHLIIAHSTDSILIEKMSTAPNVHSCDEAIELLQEAIDWIKKRKPATK